MKKFFTGFAIAVLTLVFCTAFLHLLPKKQQKPLNVTYRITYQTTNGEAIEAFMFKENGSYPTEYKAGKTARVDDLRGKMVDYGTVDWWNLGDEIEYPPVRLFSGAGVPDPDNPYMEHEFWGWYLDKECKKPFDGMITKRMEGDIILYADIQISFWTKPY